jgi:hypothetical protein
MANELKVISDKEHALAVAIKALDDAENHAYRYFVHNNQVGIAKDTSDDLFKLYLQGASCNDIRRTRIGFSLGQIVACKVQHSWDERRAQYRRDLATNVPARAGQVHLEQVEFMADLLTATQHATKEKIRQYMVTGDSTHLVDVPMPKNMKDYRDLFELFMKGTGQEKRRIEVSGSVTVDNKTGIANAVTPEEAGAIMDELMDADIVDVEVEPVRVQETQAPGLPPGFQVPRTPDDMVAFLMKTGVPETKAKALVESMGKDADTVARRYSALAMELLNTKPDVN